MLDLRRFKHRERIQAHSYWKMSVTKMLPKMLRHSQVCAHHFPKLVGIFFLSQT